MARRKHPEKPGPSGFLVVDKPAGWTSHDVVDAARRWCGTRRVGHLGTLDPQATGVLPLAIRDATKLIPYLPSDPKIYRGVIRLGVETDSYDGEGEVVARHDGPLPEEDALRVVIASFLGDHEQIPPMFSAIKHDGVPLYRLARKGEEVRRKPRKVTIREFELLRYEPPDAEVRVVCSPGTYVRVLAMDVGVQLGCGAYLKALCRLQSGSFTIEQAEGPDLLRAEAEDGAIGSHFVRPASALGLPTLKLQPEETRRVRNGGSLVAGGPPREPGHRVAAIDPAGELVAILEVAKDRRLKPLRVLGHLAGGR